MAHIDIVPASGRVTVRWAGQIVVDTTNALELREGSYPPVLYLPREDAKMDLFARSTRHSTCPYKGEASYFSLEDGAKTAKDVVWTYETPKPEVAAIAGRLAFYPDKVEITRA